MADIVFNPTFQHQDWIDNVDRVTAGGPNGFNIRFQQLSADLKTLSDLAQVIAQQLAAVGTKPPPTEQTIALVPALSPIGKFNWELINGIAQKQGTNASASGLMTVTLPQGAVLRRILASGANTGTTPQPVRITLYKRGLSTVSNPIQLAQVQGTLTFNQTTAVVPGTEVVANDQFTYYIEADWQGNSADSVQISSFQIVYLPAA